MKLMLGDCIDKMKELQASSVDTIITDPPYGLSFMGKKWDYDVPKIDIWRECLRVTKPGGTLLCFAGTRTQHRMACKLTGREFIGIEKSAEYMKIAEARINATEKRLL
tara:strand:- start:146 stop:469 length:324 start_codon:yes stop_codon:yes gene_type:complete